MKNILLPTDFSENSINAIEYALDFFKGQACIFYVLNVQKASHFIMDDLMAAPAHTSLHQTITENPKKQLHSIVKKLKSRHHTENYVFKPLIDFDVFTQAIKQAIKAHSIDLILMGSNGATGAAEVIFGSNTLNVIRKIKSPMLIIPKDYKFKSLKTLLFAINYDVKLSNKGIKPLGSILKKHNAYLKVLKINENDPSDVTEQDDREDLKGFLKNFDHKIYSVSNLPMNMAIDNFVQLEDIDMTTLFIEKESFIARFFKGSETSKINYGTRVPLLILHH